MTEHIYPGPKKNRFCVFFSGHGFVPARTDEPYEFETSPPRKIGDDAIIRAGRRRHLVRLLRSHGHAKDGLWLVRLRAA